MLDAYHDSAVSRGLLWTVASIVLLFLILPTLIVVPLSFSASDLLEFPPGNGLFAGMKPSSRRLHGWER